MVVEILHWFRVIFGLIFLLFVPGYAFTLVLFPKKRELTLIERIGFAGALSILMDILITLFIDLVLHIPTTSFNILISLVIFTSICLGIWRLELLILAKYQKSYKKKITNQMVEKKGLAYKPKTSDPEKDEVLEFIKEKRERLENDKNKTNKK